MPVCDSMDCIRSDSSVLHYLWEFFTFMSFESVMLSNHLLLCPALLLLPSNFPIIRVFSNELAFHIAWPKYWSFSFSISPSNEYLGSISFRIDWFDVLAVQGTLKRLLQHHSSVLSCLAFLMVQLSHLYVTTGKTMAFDYTDFLSTKWYLCVLVCCLCLL